MSKLLCGESPVLAGGSKLPLHSKITLLPFGRDVAMTRQSKQAFSALALRNVCLGCGLNAGRNVEMV